jgi:hypothetical protein
MHEKEIESRLRNLPDHLRREVIDFIEFLAMKYKRDDQRSSMFKFDWENGLSELKNKFDSVGLQHAAQEWR